MSQEPQSGSLTVIPSLGLIIFCLSPWRPDNTPTFDLLHRSGHLRPPLVSFHPPFGFHKQVRWLRLFPEICLHKLRQLTAAVLLPANVLPDGSTEMLSTPGWQEEPPHGATLFRYQFIYSFFLIWVLRWDWYPRLPGNSVYSQCKLICVCLFLFTIQSEDQTTPERMLVLTTLKGQSRVKMMRMRQDDTGLCHFWNLEEIFALKPVDVSSARLGHRNSSDQTLTAVAAAGIPERFRSCPCLDNVTRGLRKLMCP